MNIIDYRKSCCYDKALLSCEVVWSLLWSRLNKTSFGCRKMLDQAFKLNFDHWHSARLGFPKVTLSWHESLHGHIDPRCRVSDRQRLFSTSLVLSWISTSGSQIRLPGSPSMEFWLAKFINILSASSRQLDTIRRSLGAYQPHQSVSRIRRSPSSPTWCEDAYSMPGNAGNNSRLTSMTKVQLLWGSL